MSKTAVVIAQQRWEYMYLARKSESALITELNVLGQEDWDMISLHYHKDPKGVMTWTGFLKRPCAAAGVAAPVHGQGAPQAARRDDPGDTEPKGFDLSGDVFDVKKE